MVIRYGILLALTGVSIDLIAQQGEAILLINPSFEDQPGISRPPRGWYTCGPVGSTPPDVHPSTYFGVRTPPRHGRTYLGMVIRADGTGEALGQQLAQPLLAHRTYRLTLYAARSDHYVSVSRVSGQTVNYAHPACIRIWGGNRHGQKSELLAVSAPIDSTSWQRIAFDLTPSQDYEHLFIESHPPEGAPFPPGNVLLDQLSPLVEATYWENLPVVSPDPPPANSRLPELPFPIPRLVFRDAAQTAHYGAPDLYRWWISQDSPQPELAVSAGSRKAWKLKKAVLEAALFELGITSVKLVRKR